MHPDFLWITRVVEQHPKAKVNAVLCYYTLFWLVTAGYAVVFFNPGLVGANGQFNIHLSIFAGEAIHIRILQV